MKDISYKTIIAGEHKDKNTLREREREKSWTEEAGILLTL